VCIDGAEGLFEYRRLRRRVGEQEGDAPPSSSSIYSSGTSSPDRLDGTVRERLVRDTRSGATSTM
jgi:hypothetical protein